MTVRLLRAGDRRAAPWKNGGGVTREIAAFPPGADLDTFDWRISMASVSDGGPFSIFPGVDRVLSVLEGELNLTFEGGDALKLTPDSEPAAFPGDIAVRAEVPSGPVTDLNVMTRRGRIRVCVGKLSTDTARSITTGETTLILALSAGVRLLHAGAVHELGRHDAALFRDAEGDSIGIDAAHPADFFQIDFRR